MAAVVLLEDADVETCAARGERRLLGGDRQTGDAAAVLGRREAGEAAPAAADLEHAVAGTEPEPLADPPVLAPLRVRERLAGMLEDGAGVRHRLVEHQLEEVVAEVVVVGDVPPRAQQAVAPVEARPRLEQPAPAGVPVGRGGGVPEQQLEQHDEVVAVPLAGGVRLADAELAARRDPAEEGVVVDRQRGRRAAPKRRVWPRQPHLERAALEPRQSPLEHRDRDPLEQRQRARAGAPRKDRSTVLTP